MKESFNIIKIIFQIFIYLFSCSVFYMTEISENVKKNKKKIFKIEIVESALRQNERKHFFLVILSIIGQENIQMRLLRG